MSGTVVGLRADVDTLRGTRDGVPALMRVLAQHGVHGSFFFSVGPDNMGRHLWRLFRPSFLAKMLRTRAASLYGWDILLRGTLWPGPTIGHRVAGAIRACAEAGHEIGLHAWDHHHWQARVARMNAAQVKRTFDRGLALMERIGAPASCAAAPAWRCTDVVLRAREAFPQLRFGSDCRGDGVFLPLVEGRPVAAPQIPANLPTYDEAVGRNGLSPERWNDYLLERIRPGGYNVLTIHAEVEGIAALKMFDALLGQLSARGCEVGPLSRLLPDDLARLPVAAVRPGTVAGREGWLSVRADVDRRSGDGRDRVA